MHFRILSMFAAVAMVVACESTPDQSASQTGTGGVAASSAPVQSGRAGVRPGTQEDLVANVGDRILFDTDRSDLKPEARQLIERWAAWLRQYPNVTVTIEGHCDERGTREYNLALGDRRAAAARQYLASLGIDARRMNGISYGKERPAVVGSIETAWSQNRRAVMVVN